MKESSFSLTTTTLLEGLLDFRGDEAWMRFDARYRPVLVAVLGKMGLSEEDTADVAQEAMTVFVQDYRAGKYDRAKGRLGAWILGIARHRVLKLWHARDRRRERSFDTALLQLGGSDPAEELWEAECRQVILERALGRLRTGTEFSGRTIEAFELCVLEELPASEVAARLEMTPQAVYMAKHHCASRLREFIGELNEAYEIEDRR